MAPDLDLDDRPLPERVALATLAHCVRRTEGRVHTGHVSRTCRTHRDALGVEALGRLGEAEVSRALNRLEAEGLVESERQDTTPTGKGRPAYRPVPGVEDVLRASRADEQVRGLVEAFEEA